MEHTTCYRCGNANRFIDANVRCVLTGNLVQETCDKFVQSDGCKMYNPELRRLPIPEKPKKEVVLLPPVPLVVKTPTPEPPKPVVEVKVLKEKKVQSKGKPSSPSKKTSQQLKLF